MSVSQEDKEEVINLLKNSLIRHCGGGIASTHDHSSSTVRVPARKFSLASSVCSNDNSDRDFSNIDSMWVQKLTSMAMKSISFSNGKNKEMEVGDEDKVENIGKGHDIEIRIASSLFHQYSKSKDQNREERQMKMQRKIKKKRRIDQYNDLLSGKQSNTCVLDACDELLGDEMNCNRSSPSIEIKSELGFIRTICSPLELSSFLVNDMEDQLWYRRTSKISSDTDDNDDASDSNIMMIQSNHSGIICIVTKKRFEFLRSNDRYPCSHCVKWCKGQKGLWWHEQIVHGLDHSIASTVATASSSSFDTMAIIPYEKNTRNISNIAINTSEEFVTEGKNNCDQDPFFDSIKNGDYDTLINLTKLKKYDAKCHRDKNGAYGLHWASGCGHLTIVKYLIEHCNCPPDQIQKGKRSFHRRTPLHWAARNGHLDVVKYLVEECDIDVDAKTIDGTTAFSWASWQGHLHVMRCVKIYEYLMTYQIRLFESFF